MKLKHFLSASMTCAAVSVSAMIPALLAPIAARIAAELGHGSAWSCVLFACCYLPSIFACLFTGKLLSAAGRHFAVSLSLAACALAAAFLAYSSRPLTVCLGLALLGSASALLLVSGVEALRVLFVCSVPECLPWCAIPMGFGAAAAAISSGFLTQHGYHWHEIWLYFAVLAALLTLLHIVVPYPHIRRVNVKLWQNEFVSALRVQRMYPCFFAAFLYAGVQEVVAGWMAARTFRALGYTAFVTSTALAIIWLCAAIGRVACTQLAARVSPLGVAVTLVLILACSLGICTAFADGRLFWIAIFGIGIGLSGIWQLLFAGAVTVNGGECATFSALLAWGYAGAALVPPFADAVGSLLGTRAVIITSILLALANLTLFGSVVQRKPLHIVPFLSERHVEAEWEAIFLEDLRELNAYPHQSTPWPEETYDELDTAGYDELETDAYTAFADDDEFADFFKDLDRYDDLKPFENFEEFQLGRAPRTAVAEDLQNLEAAEGLEVLDEAEESDNFSLLELPFYPAEAEPGAAAGAPEAFAEPLSPAAAPAEPPAYSDPLNALDVLGADALPPLDGLDVSNAGALDALDLLDAPDAGELPALDLLDVSDADALPPLDLLDVSDADALDVSNADALPAGESLPPDESGDEWLEKQPTTELFPERGGPFR